MLNIRKDRNGRLPFPYMVAAAVTVVMLVIILVGDLFAGFYFEGVVEEKLTDGELPTDYFFKIRITDEANRNYEIGELVLVSVTQNEYNTHPVGGSFSFSTADIIGYAEAV